MDSMCLVQHIKQCFALFSVFVEGYLVTNIHSYWQTSLNNCSTKIKLREKIMFLEWPLSFLSGLY